MVVYMCVGTLMMLIIFFFCYDKKKWTQIHLKGQTAEKTISSYTPNPIVSSTLPLVMENVISMTVWVLFGKLLKWRVFKIAQ